METIFQHPRFAELALFSPKDTTKALPGFPAVCVSTFNQVILQKFAAMEGVVQAASLTTANGPIPIYRIVYQGVPIAFYQSPVGAPVCVAAFEEVVALGAKAFVLFGSCGVLDEEKTEGRIIVPVSAVRDEGCSYHYLAPSPEIEADPGCVRVLTDTLSRCGCPYVEGKTWTTDAIYRETIPSIAQRKAEGCIAVEMECASMLAVSRYRKIPFVQFLYGADSLASDTWDMRDLCQYGRGSAEKYMALAFACGVGLMEMSR